MSPRAGLTLLASSVALAGLAIIYSNDPAKSSFYPPCPFKALTGLQCPGCGGTRALYALLHGDVAAAFTFNPMLFVLMAAAVVIAIRPVILTRPWFAWAAGATLMGWGVARNIVG